MRVASALGVLAGRPALPLPKRPRAPRGAKKVQAKPKRPVPAPEPDDEPADGE